MQISPFQPIEKFSKMVIVFGKVMSQFFEERTNLKVPSENKPPLIIRKSTVPAGFDHLMNYSRYAL